MDDKHKQAAMNALGKLHPLCELGDEQRQAMLKGAWLERLSANSILYAENDARWFTYIIDGEMALGTDKGLEEPIHAGSPRSRLPLFRVHPRDLRAETRGGCALMRFDRQLYERLSVTAIDDDAEERVVLGGGGHSLFEQIYHAYRNDELELPSLPEVATQVREALEDPTITLKAVAKILHTDPALSARLLQVANSAAYSRGGSVESIFDAVTRMGLETTHNLAVAFSLKQLFEARSPAIKERLAELYRHSTLIASLSYVLARESGHLKPERALLAGLLHDIGIIPILLYADRNPEQFEEEAELEAVIGRLRGLVGNLVLSRLGFEADLIAVTEEAELWLREGEGEADYCDLVLLAHLHSRLGSPQMHELPRIDETPAFHRLEPGEFDPVEGLELLNRARHITSALQAGLH